MITLGIESSCDETSIALYNGKEILANSTYTQHIHSKYGGVVPEIASRAHIKKIEPLCLSVLSDAGLSLADIGLIAVTDSPGLPGALLVGISFALGIHCGFNIPVTGVNHLEVHIASAALENPKLSFPFLALVVSGGHTAIYIVNDFGQKECLGQTIDDAAGEAFDKIGKMLGFRYPAGKDIGDFAAEYDKKDIINFPIAKIKKEGYNFSFSGLKTAVKYFIEKQDGSYIENNKPMICYSVQKAIVNSLLKNIVRASSETGIRNIAVVGGVACNSYLRSEMKKIFGGKAVFPSIGLCTDNAAMIAKAGYENYMKGNINFPRMKPSGTK